METAKVVNDLEGQAIQPRKGSARAGVSYPYFDQDDSLDVARKIQDNAGGSCSADQLAYYLNYKSTKSGTYQTRVSAAKQFGFVKTDNGQISVTDRAMQIISPVLPEDAINAKSDAFLSVELFSKVYEKYKGTTIPPKAGMRNLLQQTYAITTDRLDPAIRVLFASAEQAGFFQGGDQSRLVRNAIKPTNTRVVPPVDSAPQLTREHIERNTHAAAGATSNESHSSVHAAIVGLLRELPPAGAQWNRRGKDRFVKAFLATLDFVYPNDEEDAEPATKGVQT
jgi:hypothetical protein